MSKKPTVLMILDGYGLNDRTDGNAVAQAKTPVMDQLMKEYPFVKGNASGLAVGLPDGQMGNSEVGHMNMGAGRIVYQELTRITKRSTMVISSNQALLDGMENVKKIILTFIYMDFFLTVVFIAISHMFMVCWNLRKERESRMSMYTVS